MKRRDFCRSISAGSAALASLPSVSRSQGVPAQAHGFRFVCVSRAEQTGVVLPFINMNGSGTFHSSSLEVNGGGSYDLFDRLSPLPKTILSAGGWRAKHVLSFAPLGTYGVLTAGTLEMDLDLLQELPSRAILPATIRIVCNIGAAIGLDTGELQGFTLTIPSAPFGPLHPFEVPAPGSGFTFGNTIFTRGEEEH
jgi:hypothetical protein